MENLKKMEMLKRFNMFYIVSFRTTEKQVTGFSIKLVRYDIVEKIYRSTFLVGHLYKPRLSQRKENTIKNGINTKKFKGKFSKYSETKDFKNQTYEIVNNQKNIVFTNNLNSVSEKFLSKNFPEAQKDNLIRTNYEMNSSEMIEFERIEDVFKDVMNFEDFIEKQLKTK